MMIHCFVKPTVWRATTNPEKRTLLGLVCCFVMVLGVLIPSEHLTAAANPKNKIVEVLFGLEPGTAGNETFHSYNDYKDNPQWEGKVGGYIGGHSGWDVQTQNVAGAKPPVDVPFYSLTVGKVIYVEPTFNTIAVHNADDKKTVLYLHARRIYVEKDDDVFIGTCLGIQGNTGIKLPPEIPEAYKAPHANPDDYPENYAEHVHIEVIVGEPDLVLKYGPADGASDAKSPTTDPVPYLYESIVKNQFPAADVNRDGKVDWVDVELIVDNLGENTPQFDLNSDGIVNIQDLVVIVKYLKILLRDLRYCDVPASPTHNRFAEVPVRAGQVSIGSVGVSQEMVQQWLDIARQTDDGSLAFKQAIAVLENLLMPIVPRKTALFANYPNPFNPETWMPYYLATDANVTVTIYDASGTLVRQLDGGHQKAGYYTSRNRAAYWDGRSETGERVASGVYFYTLTAGSYIATRKMVVLK